MADSEVPWFVKFLNDEDSQRVELCPQLRFGKSEAERLAGLKFNTSGSILDKAFDRDVVKSAEILAPRPVFDGRATYEDVLLLAVLGQIHMRTKFSPALLVQNWGVWHTINSIHNLFWHNQESRITFLSRPGVPSDLAFITPDDGMTKFDGTILLTMSLRGIVEDVAARATQWSGEEWFPKLKPPRPGPTADFKVSDVERRLIEAVRGVKAPLGRKVVIDMSPNCPAGLIWTERKIDPNELPKLEGDVRRISTSREKDGRIAYDIERHVKF